MTRTVIDPVTRVTGQLRLELEVDGGIVRDAWVSGTMYRGLERILVGRDPREAWLLAERICGTCGPVHAIASARAVEQALGIHVPRNARLLRNLVAGVQLVADHIGAFYQRQLLDWVDAQAATRADAGAASRYAQSLGEAPSSGVAYFETARSRLSRLLDSSQPGPFAGGPWGHRAYQLSPEADLVLLTHSLDAIDVRRRLLRLHTLVGGKRPHPQSFLVGGMAVSPPWGGPANPAPGQHQWSLGREAPAALGDDGLEAMGTIVDEAVGFAEEILLPDVIALVGSYGNWAEVGSGRGHFLAFGDLPEDDSDRPSLLLPRGRVMDRDVSRLIEVGETGVAESTAHAWYGPDDQALRRPGDGRTEPQYAGPRPPFTTLEGYDRYSWVKAPRYEDDPMETGPLARTLVATAADRGDQPLRFARAFALTGVAPAAALGTLGRLLAPAVEAVVVAQRLRGWLRELEANLADGDLAVADATRWSPATWPATAEGWALGESGRGAIGHWVAIRDGRVERYQIVDAGTWNASPRDSRGRRGALEEALVGTPVADLSRPVEALRVVHAFDPCLSCGVH